MNQLPERDHTKPAAELRRLAALSESNAIDALNYESRIERLQAENDALRAMHDAAPKVEAEPVAFMWQHDETGRTGFCSRFDLENGFESNNPRLKIVGPLYTHPAAPQPDALPDLSDAEIGRLVDRMDNTHDSDLLKFARAVIAAMKGKQWAINEYL